MMMGKQARHFAGGFVCILLCLLVLCGCQSSVRVSGRAIRPYEYPAQRYDGSCWSDNLWEKSPYIALEDKHHTLAAVRVRTNYFYALATVLTFGLWTPIDLEWEENCD